MASFVHLRVKSAYSLLEGAVRPKELAELAREAACRRWPSPTPTICSASMRSPTPWPRTGVQPIVGALLSVELDDRARRARPAQPQEAAASAAAGAERGRLPQSHQASQRRLSGGRAGRLAACEGENAGRPCRRPDRADRRAGRSGQRAAAGRPDAKRLRRCWTGWRRCSATGFMSNCSVMAWPKNAPPKTALLDLAYAKDLPLVATNDVHFGKADMYEAHDALLCIADGAFVSQDDRRRLTREHRFKTAGRNGGAIRRSARSDREHDRDRPALRLPARASAIPSCRYSCRNPAAPPEEELKVAGGRGA